MKLPHGVSERAHAIMDMATGRRREPELGPGEQSTTMQALRGAANLTPAERSEIARITAVPRWSKA